MPKTPSLASSHDGMHSYHTSLLIFCIIMLFLCLVLQFHAILMLFVHCLHVEDSEDINPVTSAVCSQCAELQQQLDVTQKLLLQSQQLNTRLQTRLLEQEEITRKIMQLEHSDDLVIAQLTQKDEIIDQLNIQCEQYRKQISQLTEEMSERSECVASEPQCSETRLEQLEQQIAELEAQSKQKDETIAGMYYQY